MQGMADTPGDMLRNVIIHIANDQPLRADLLAEPGPVDVSLVCRNVRALNGKKPSFVDFADSTFLIPISAIRLLEIPAESYAEDARKRPESQPARAAGEGVEDRRLALPRADGAPRETPGDGQSKAATPSAGDAGLFDDDLDSDLLRRIHDA